MEWFDAITSRLANLGGTIAFFGLVLAIAPRAWQKYKAWRRERSRRNLEQDIASLKRLQNSPSARTAAT
jgi:hypothetical protein